MTDRRGIPHAFWNAGTEPVRFLELIFPGGFEEYFFELAGPFNAHDEQGMGEVVGRHGLDVRTETIGELLERNRLQPPFQSLPASGRGRARPRPPTRGAARAAAA